MPAAALPTHQHPHLWSLRAAGEVLAIVLGALSQWTACHLMLMNTPRAGNAEQHGQGLDPKIPRCRKCPDRDINVA